MGNRDDEHVVRIDDVHEGVWKGHKRLRSDTVFDHSRDFRILLDSSICGLDFSEKSIAQAGGLSVVIANGFRELGVRRFVESRLHPRCRASNFVNTSSAPKDLAVPSFNCRYRRAASSTHMRSYSSGASSSRLSSKRFASAARDSTLISSASDAISSKFRPIREFYLWPAPDLPSTPTHRPSLSADLRAASSTRCWA